MAGVNVGKMKILDTKKVIQENETVKSFYFEDRDIAKAEPGQFVMMWVPHVASKKVDFEIPDQVPMSVSYTEGDTFSVTVKKCGRTTDELFKYKKRDKIGITGPLGRGFSLSGENVLCVAGGIGAAPLLLLVKRLRNREVHFILGVKTKEEILFQERLAGCNLYVTTDDGSYGGKGFASDHVEKFCQINGIDQIYCCGPEKMMHKVFEISTKLRIPAQFSLERYMYCGLGLCGHCAVDGFLVCKDGPVFTSEELKDIKDFGAKKVDETGRKVDI